MISETEAVQELIDRLSEDLGLIMNSENFPYAAEVSRLKNLSEASILLGKLFTELGRRIKTDVKWKDEEHQAIGKFDWQDYSLWLHPIDHRNLEKLVKEVLDHIQSIHD